VNYTEHTTIRAKLKFFLMSANSIFGENSYKGNSVLTPKRYARSNSRVPTPTCTFVFMLFMSPGIVGGTETIIAAAARQFCERHKGRNTRSTFGKQGLQYHMYTCTFHGADTSQERQHACGVRANTKRQSHDQSLHPLLKGLRGLTSVTMIPVMGPRKTV